MGDPPRAAAHTPRPLPGSFSIILQVYATTSDGGQTRTARKHGKILGYDARTAPTHTGAAHDTRKTRVII